MKLALIAIAAVLLLLAGAAAYVVLPLRLPSPTGSYGIAERSLSLPASDPALPTPIARIWYPTGGDMKSMPVLVYLPSWTGTAIEDHFLINDLVSQGYAVVGLRYPKPAEVEHGNGKVRAEQPGGMDFSSGPAYEQTIALADARVRARARNVAAVLDFISGLNEEAGSPLQHRLDLDRVGVWGFSLGGAAAAQAAWLDHRVKAVVNLDGWLFAEAAGQGVPCPYLLIGDGTPLPTDKDLKNPRTKYSATLDLQDYDHQISGLKRYGGFVLTIDGATHLNFTDGATRSRLRRLTGAGPIDPRRALVMTAAYMRDFFGKTLLDRPSSLLAGDHSPYPEIHMQVFAGNVRP